MIRSKDKASDAQFRQARKGHTYSLKMTEDEIRKKTAVDTVVRQQYLEEDRLYKEINSEIDK